MNSLNKPYQSGRRDLEIIQRMVPKHARVLDLGCGDGAFLRQLREGKGVDGMGVEMDQGMIGRCIANGVPVIQSRLDRTLDFAENDSFDIVILSRTLQELKHPDAALSEVVRVGKKAIVSFINFGYWQCRVQLLFTGRMPRTKVVPYQWYDTPNIHLGTIRDFRVLCAKLDIEILSETALGQDWDAPAKFRDNLFAPGCVFELRRKQD